eukprot:6211479-Pleurochrysis_carterae.AAC.3
MSEELERDAREGRKLVQSERQEGSWEGTWAEKRRTGRGWRAVEIGRARESRRAENGEGKGKRACGERGREWER